MSVRADSTRPYTDEEKEQLLTRPSGEALIAINERQFAHLSKKEKAALVGRALEDDEKDAHIKAVLEEQDQEDEAESYHPDDVAQVQALTIKELRQRLDKEGQRTTVTAEDKESDDDDGDPFTEKEVLSYRLLNHLDEKRKAAQPPEPFDEEDDDED